MELAKDTLNESPRDFRILAKKMLTETESRVNSEEVESSRTGPTKSETRVRANFQTCRGPSLTPLRYVHTKC